MINYFFRFDHLTLAALRAISIRCSFVSFFALAGPPFLPPRRPNSTAAGFFFGRSSSGSSWSWPVARSTITLASSFGSRDLLPERLGIHRLYTKEKGEAN